MPLSDWFGKVPDSVEFEDNQVIEHHTQHDAPPQPAYQLHMLGMSRATRDNGDIGILLMMRVLCECETPHDIELPAVAIPIEHARSIAERLLAVIDDE